MEIEMEIEKFKFTNNLINF